MTGVSALYGIRLCTPRLELRLGSRAELEALAEVAKAGIHPPHEMPFAVAWTDASDDPDFVTDFVAHHEQTLAAWSPEEWRLNLLAFHDGRRSACRRSVPPGSRSTAPSTPGRGSAREPGPRARDGDAGAVLELAFGCLGARAAQSGWLEGGAAQSAGVSARLGYREVRNAPGAATRRASGHHDLLLARSEWACPFAWTSRVSRPASRCSAPHRAHSERRASVARAYSATHGKRASERRTAPGAVRRAGAPRARRRRAPSARRRLRLRAPHGCSRPGRGRGDGHGHERGSPRPRGPARREGRRAAHPRRGGHGGAAAFHRRVVRRRHEQALADDSPGRRPHAA